MELRHSQLSLNKPFFPQNSRDPILESQLVSLQAVRRGLTERGALDQAVVERMLSLREGKARSPTLPC